MLRVSIRNVLRPESSVKISAPWILRSLQTIFDNSFDRQQNQRHQPLDAAPNKTETIAKTAVVGGARKSTKKGAVKKILEVLDNKMVAAFNFQMTDLETQLIQAFNYRPGSSLAQHTEHDLTLTSGPQALGSETYTEDFYLPDENMILVTGTTQQQGHTAFTPFEAVETGVIQVSKPSGTNRTIIDANNSSNHLDSEMVTFQPFTLCTVSYSLPHEIQWNYLQNQVSSPESTQFILQLYNVDTNTFIHSIVPNRTDISDRGVITATPFVPNIEGAYEYRILDMTNKSDTYPTIIATSPVFMVCDSSAQSAVVQATIAAAHGVAIKPKFSPQMGPIPDVDLSFIHSAQFRAKIDRNRASIASDSNTGTETTVSTAASMTVKDKILKRQPTKTSTAAVSKAAKPRKIEERHTTARPETAVLAAQPVAPEVIQQTVATVAAVHIATAATTGALLSADLTTRISGLRTTSEPAVVAAADVADAASDDLSSPHFVAVEATKQPASASDVISRIARLRVAAGKGNSNSNSAPVTVVEPVSATESMRYNGYPASSGPVVGAVSSTEKPAQSLSSRIGLIRAAAAASDAAVKKMVRPMARITRTATATSNAVKSNSTTTKLPLPPSPPDVDMSFIHKPGKEQHHEEMGILDASRPKALSEESLNTHHRQDSTATVPAAFGTVVRSSANAENAADDVAVSATHVVAAVDVSSRLAALRAKMAENTQTQAHIQTHQPPPVSSMKVAVATTNNDDESQLVIAAAVALPEVFKAVISKSESDVVRVEDGQKNVSRSILHRAGDSVKEKVQTTEQAKLPAHQGTDSKDYFPRRTTFSLIPGL